MATEDQSPRSVNSWQIKSISGAEIAQERQRDVNICEGGHQETEEPK